jgi:osmotically inducible lipoprotein OsmB
LSFNTHPAISPRVDCVADYKASFCTGIPTLRNFNKDGTDSVVWGNDFWRLLMSNKIKLLGVLATFAVLSACGETDAERTATGAVIGGAVAAVTGENIVNGALIGGAAGAVSCSVAPANPQCI